MSARRVYQMDITKQITTGPKRATAQKLSFFFPDFVNFITYQPFYNSG